MKRLCTVVVLLAGLSITQACNNSTNKQDSVDSANNMNEQKDTSGMTSSRDTMSTMPVDKDVADFAVEAANGSMMEVAMGKLAEQKATNQRVKDFGAMMIQDHGAAGEELQRLASAKNITLPSTVSKDAQKEIDDLNKKSGKDFDKAYMNMMLDDHKKDVKKFEKAGSDLKDADVKNFAVKTLPTLQKHLDSAKVISSGKI